MQVLRIAFVVLALCAVQSAAQTHAEITGEVMDSSGAVIAGATVTVTNEGTNVARRVVTSSAGVYSVPALQPGLYALKAEMTGFKTQVRRGIELQIQQVARIDFHMEVGQVSEVVEVTAAAPLLTTESATTGTVIENKRIVELPLNGRNYLQLVSLSPNVSFGFAPLRQAVGRQGGDRPQWAISVAGQRAAFNNYTLDGVSNTNPNFNTYIFAPSIDAVQEFKVQTGVYPAEFGRVTSQINVMTKAGTNQFHGSLFEFFRNDDLDAREFAFTAARPAKDPFVRNQYGFALGGPVIVPKLFNGRDKLFFLANYEALRDRKGRQTLATVPTEAMRRGDFSAITTPLFDPTTRVRGADGRVTAQRFPNNVIPSNRFNAKSVKLLEFYPAPNAPGSINYQGAEVRRSDTDQFTTRLDFAENSASNWFGRYSWGDELLLNPRTFKLQGEKLETGARQATISNTRILAPTVVNEFRFGYVGLHNTLGNFLGGVRDVIGEVGGLPGLPPPTPDLYGLPSIGITGYSGFGDSSDGPFIGHDHTFQWIDNVSIMRGKHSFKFGGEVRRDRFNQIGNQFARGTFSFTGSASRDPSVATAAGNGFADFMLGYINSDEATLGLANSRLRATAMSFFFDDTWKIRPNFTVNAGLRYENTPPYYHVNDAMVTVDIPSFFDPALRPTLVRPGNGDFYEGIPFRFHPSIQVARDGRFPRALVRRDNNDFAPRLGISYSPRNWWTIRAGIGAFYVQDIGNWRFDMSRNLAGRRFETTDPNFPNLTWDNPFGTLGSTVLVTTPLVLANDLDGRTGYVWQYLLNLQFQVSANTLVEFGYTGNISRKLEVWTMANYPLPGPGAVQPRRPYPELAVIQSANRVGNAYYNGLSLKVEKRYASGFTGLVGYTFSRSIDNGSAIRVHIGDTDFPQNIYDRRDRRGLSAFHQKHRLATSLLYDVPVGRGKRLDLGGAGNAVLGGWQFGNIFSVRTGQPFTVTSGMDRPNVGFTAYPFPDATGVSPKLENADPQRWFNPAAFAQPAPLTFGNSARNNVIGPGHINWDFSLMKNFSMPLENHRLQFRLEAFNLPNHPNFGLPSATLTSATFTRITSLASPMRELQFSLKYVF